MAVQKVCKIWENAPSGNVKSGFYCNQYNIHWIFRDCDIALLVYELVLEYINPREKSTNWKVYLPFGNRIKCLMLLVDD